MTGRKGVKDVWAGPDDLLVFNGVNGETGDYLLPPLRPAVVAALAQDERVDRAEAGQLAKRYEQTTGTFLGPIDRVDAGDLAQAGWGVIFASDADPAVRRALQPLLDHRRRQAARIDERHYREYVDADGYRAGESASDFLVRHQVAPGQPANPRRMPYYLLLVGDPEQIPYRFQYLLDVVYAVGRLDLHALEDYARYAWSVVEAERAGAAPARATFFGVRNTDDRPTMLSTDHLVTPLADAVAARFPAWSVARVTHAQATKAELSSLLGGDGTPGLLFLAGHGMGFPRGDPRQLAQQGALLCQDWPGRLAWRKRIPQDFYFAGDDVTGEARLAGLVVFLHACYGAGTPRTDDFVTRALDVPAVIAPRAFVGRLPQRLLSHPNGGALAVIGHVERSWTYSFLWPGVGEQTDVYESMLGLLLQGAPVGRAVEYMNDRCAALTTELEQAKEDIFYGKVPDDLALSMLWTARNDARNCIVLGDPAVRLGRPVPPYEA
jgi:hypothetical protein